VSAMSGIFISYRRSDSAPHAGRLHDRLCDYFGADKAVIGKGWLAHNENNGKSRLDDPTDFVRLELQHALQRDILLIPALVEGAEMPHVEDLPAPLSELSQRQAVELSDKDFQRGVDKIIAVLEQFPALRLLRTKKDPREKTTQSSTVRRPRSWGAPVAILIVMLFLAWQWSFGKKKETVHSTAETFAGAWEANVIYGWGDSYKEQFRFKPEDSRLFGTASFLGAARGIEDGKIEGDVISFSVRFQEMLGSATTERKNNYRGKSCTSGRAGGLPFAGPSKGPHRKRMKI
jgi:hypothetical protein